MEKRELLCPEIKPEGFPADPLHMHVARVLERIIGVYVTGI